MGKQSGVRFDLDAGGSLVDVLRRLDEMGKPQKVIENSIMRDLSYSAARRLEPVVERAVASSPAPQARALSGTVRAKRDRMIVLTAGAVNPRLSGVRRNAANKQWRGSLAWGVASGPYSVGGMRRVAAHQRRRRRGARHQVAAHTRRTGNVYRVPRRGSAGDPFAGYLAPLKQKVIDATIEEYRDIVLEVVRRNGWTDLR